MRGHKTSEEELAAEFSVTRPTVRAVLAALRASGAISRGDGPRGVRRRPQDHRTPPRAGCRVGHGQAGSGPRDRGRGDPTPRARPRWLPVEGHP
ncbi:GntR family transcriptional regulator [Streptomyces daliensis]